MKEIKIDSTGLGNCKVEACGEEIAEGDEIDNGLGDGGQVFGLSVMAKG